MQIRSLTTGDPLAASADLLVVPAGTPADRLDGAAAALDRALGGLIAACVADGEFDAKAGSSTVLHTRGDAAAPRAVLVGTGEGGVEDWRDAGRAAGRTAGRLKARRVVLAAGGADAERVTALVTGFGAGEHRDDRFRTGEAAGRPRVESLEVHADAASQRDVVRAARIAEAVAATRRLVDAPGNALTPTALAERARALADGVEGLTCEVLDRDALEEMGAGALLGVARGSAEPPVMIVLRWSPPGAPGDGPVLGLVGKAVTFDTGGISIKPSNGMEEMKMDMAGGAAAVEGIGLIAASGVPLPVVAVVPATENMPSGTAVKPGDVLRTMSGTTVEVTNTDAEGRLILADALTYAHTRCGVTHMVDFATLTGAIVVALGEVYAGLFGSDDAWTARVRAAGERVGDLCWPMPMHPRYRPLIESTVADLSNSSPKRQAGAVYAAQFLREFTGGLPWCHVDVAGTAMPEGGSSGFGTALVLARGVIVRPAGPFGAPAALRITIGLPSENDRLLAALAETGAAAPPA